MIVRDVMTCDVSTVSPEHTVAQALQVMFWRDVRHLPVVSEGRVIGVITERDILAARPERASAYSADARVADVMTSPVETIHSKAELAEAAAIMAVQKVGCVPVVDAGSLVGIVTTTDLLAEMAQISVPPPKREFMASGLMTTRVVAVMPDEPLLEAAAVMVQNGIRHLPVVDGMRRVVGILSERDIRTQVGNPLEVLEREEPRRRLSELHVADAMTKDPRTLPEDASVTDAVSALLDGRYGAVPVVDEEDRLLGMISYVDVLRNVAAGPQ